MSCCNICDRETIERARTQYYKFAEDANKHIKKFMQSEAYAYLTSNTLIHDVKVITARTDAILITTTFIVPVVPELHEHIDDLLINSIDNLTKYNLSRHDRKSSRIMKRDNRENKSIENHFIDAAYDSMCINGEIAQRLINGKETVKITIYKILIHNDGLYAFGTIGDFHNKIFTVLNDGMSDAQCKK